MTDTGPFDNTPSHGEYEVLRAIRHARGRGGSHVSLDHVRHRLNKRAYGKTVTNAFIQAVLDGVDASLIDVDDDGNVALTAAGEQSSRGHAPIRSHFVVT